MTSARDVIAEHLCQHATQEFVSAPCAHCQKKADTILAALDAAGYSVVPQEPTANMLVEGNLVIARNRLFATEIYKAMLKAAKETT